METLTVSLSSTADLLISLCCLTLCESEKDVAFQIPVENHVTRTETQRAADQGSNLRCMDSGKLFWHSQPQFPRNRTGTALLYSIGMLRRSIEVIRVKPQHSAWHVAGAQQKISISLFSGNLFHRLLAFSPGFLPVA